MVNYQNGKIYKIWSDKGPKEYIGHTTRSLAKRLSEHKTDYKQKKGNEKVRVTNSVELFDEYGVENCYICLLELYPCNSSEELCMRETYYIKLYKETLTNKNNGFTSRVEILEKKKQWNYDHKEEKTEYDKIYRDEHKEEIKEYKKQYYEDHKEEIKIKIKQNIKITCICGSIFRKDSKTKHERTKKHKTYLESVVTQPVTV